MSSEATSVSATGAPVAAEYPTAEAGLRSPRAHLRLRAGEFVRGRVDATVVALASMVLGSVVIVSLAAARPTFLSPPSNAEFPGWMSGPLGALTRWYQPSHNALQIVFSVVVVGMFACYLLVLGRTDRLSPRLAIGAVVALHVVFFLSPPLSLTDVFNYLNYGRMEIVHHLNPYATAPVLEPHNDPTYLISNWHQLLSPYGPLFTLFTFALVPLGVAVSFWVLKASLLLASLLTLRLVWLCAELLGRDPLKAVLFVGLNPLVLVWGLGGDHNDSFMMVLLVASFYLLLRAQSLRADEPAPAGSRLRAVVASPAVAEIGAGIALAGAVAVKASAAILVPVLLLGASRRRARSLVGVGVGVVVGVVGFGLASLVAFGSNLPNLGDQSRLVTLYAVPNLLGLAFGSGGETDALKSALNIVLALSVAGASIWAWRTRRWLGAAGFATLMLLLTLSWTLPWYVLWLLPIAALAGTRSLRGAAIAVSIYLLLVWLPVTGRIMNAIGFKPGSTQVARMHAVQTKALLH